jgi:hypothetical protein
VQAFLRGEASLAQLTIIAYIGMLANRCRLRSKAQEFQVATASIIRLGRLSPQPQVTMSVLTRRRPGPGVDFEHVDFIREPAV